MEGGSPTLTNFNLKKVQTGNENAVILQYFRFHLI